MSLSIFKIEFLLTARLRVLVVTRRGVSDIFKYEVRQAESCGAGRNNESLQCLLCNQHSNNGEFQHESYSQTPDPGHEKDVGTKACEQLKVYLIEPKLGLRIKPQYISVLETCLLHRCEMSGIKHLVKFIILFCYSWIYSCHY